MGSTSKLEKRRKPNVRGNYIGNVIRVIASYEISILTKEETE